MLKGIHLTLLMGPLIPVLAPRAVIDALTSVQVRISGKERSGFQLGFAVSRASLIATALLPAGFFDPGVRVIIIATINGIPNVLMDGLIARQEVTASSEPGQATLSITGEDISLAMDLIDQSTMMYPAMPAEARVALIIAKYALYGMIPVVIPNPAFFDVPIPTERIPRHQAAENEEIATDLSYIKKLASENGYVFYVEAGPAPGMNLAYWGPEVRIGIPQPALTINMDAHTNVESLSFGFDGLARTQLAVVIQEPITKIGIPIPLPDISLLRPPLALRQAPALRIEPLHDVARLNPIRAAALGLSRAAESSDAVTGNGQLDVLRYGRLLRARSLVGVRGAGLAYDGLYYVSSVTHDIKPGEYKQSFTLTRNGLVSFTPVVPV